MYSFRQGTGLASMLGAGQAAPCFWKSDPSMARVVTGELPAHRYQAPINIYIQYLKNLLNPPAPHLQFTACTATSSLTHVYPARWEDSVLGNTHLPLGIS